MSAEAVGAIVPFALVDVFAPRPLSGNPLAVVGDADGLDAATMRSIAREFNQSETTFVLSPALPGATRRLRAFTPAGAEVVGAGHNALGAWWWIADRAPQAHEGGVRRVVQQLGERLLPVEIAVDGDGRPVTVTMDQAAPRFGAVVADVGGLAHALGLAADDLRSDLPIQVVDTGAAHLLVPAVDLDAVARARPDAPALLAALAAVGGQGCYLFAAAAEDPGVAATARFFNPTVGISEDPATGSAAGPLARYLVEHGLAADGSTVRVAQGQAMGRPSLLDVRVAGDSVRLEGACVVVAEGRLLATTSGDAAAARLPRLG